ncbi:MAG: mechanosensitive ion channel family protein, partial [Gammaproteobacteria bacterium]
GYSINALAAFLGGGGLAIGFSAKDMIANLFGALTIYLDQPFKVGDWVRLPEKEIEGKIEDIGLRVTRIRTFDKRPLYVPNFFFSTIVIENASRMTHRRILETIAVSHQNYDKYDAISKEVVEAMHENPMIDSGEDIVFNLTSSSSGGADMMFTAYTKRTAYKDFHEVKHTVLQEIIKIIEKNGVKVVEYQPSTKVDL